MTNETDSAPAPVGDEAASGEAVGGHRHAIAFVFVTVLIDMIGFGIVMPVLPSLIMDITGESLSAAAAYSGFLLTAYAVLQFLFAPLIGGLSDRFGRRPVLLVSLAAYAVNYLIAGFATTLLWLLLGRIMTGLTSATHATANALIADVSPPETRAQNFGLIGMAFGVGFILGPALGGLLGEINLRLPFFAAAALAAINVVYGALMLPETLPRERRRAFDWRRANPLGALLRLASFPALAVLALASFVYNIGHHVYPSIWAFFTLERFAWSNFQVGLSLACVGIVMAVVQGGVIRLVIPRLGLARTALVGFVGSALAFTGHAFAYTVPLLGFWLLVSGFTGLIGPALQGIMSNQVPQNEQGELQGVLASLSSIGAIIGPLLMTQLFARYTDSDGLYFAGAPFLAATVLTLIAMVIFVWRMRRELRNPAPASGSG
ncbi:MAG: TCR/Tet family MFS transporter [Pseudomonadota bacterium]